MLIKFFARGIGSGDGPVGYVTRVEGRESAPPDVLRGDAALTRELIDSIDREWRYTSGVISFAIEDAPSAAEQERVMDAFERTAFAGLDSDQYDILWVRHQHTEGDRVELHFVTPRLELLSGKALNIAPPNWKYHYGPLQDALNYEHGWADPNSPERARNTQRAPENALRSRDRESIGTYIETLVAANMVANRDDIILALEEIGLDVPRRGENYISVRDSEVPDSKPFRLKGKLYEQGWSIEQQLEREVGREVRGREAGDRGYNLERAASAWSEVEQRIAKRAEFHAERYRPSGREYDAALVSRLEADLVDGWVLRVHPYREFDTSLGSERVEGSGTWSASPSDSDRATKPEGLEVTDGWGIGSQVWGGRGLSPSLTGDGREDVLHLQQQEPLYQATGVNQDERQSDRVRARITEIGRKLHDWYEGGVSRLAGWFESLRHKRAGEQQRSLEASGRSYDSYRAKFGKCLSSLNTSLRGLSGTNRAIEQAIEQIKPIVRQKEQAREQTRSRDYGMER